MIRRGVIKRTPIAQNFARLRSRDEPPKKAVTSGGGRRLWGMTTERLLRNLLTSLLLTTPAGCASGGMSSRAAAPTVHVRDDSRRELVTYAKRIDDAPRRKQSPAPGTLVFFARASSRRFDRGVR
jgi:hypothetical protein